MITELKIEGFKSFGTPEQTLHFDRLNFLVGANASGKTNLISALRFLQHAVLQNAESAVNEWGGPAEVRNKRVRERAQPKPLRLSVKLDFSKAQKVGFETEDSRYHFLSFNYSVTLDLRSSESLPKVVAEILEADIEDKQRQTLRYKLQRNASEVEIFDPSQKGKAHSQKIRVPEQEATRLALGVGFFSPPCVMLRHIISNWRFFNISPQVARVPAKEIPDIDLGPAGENLAVILHKLEMQNGKGAMDAIVAGLKSTVAGFQGLKTAQLPIEGQWAFQVVEEKIRGAINPNSVSDGTIRLLAFMVIAHWTAQHASLVAIEEPENGIHPHLSEHLVQILRATAQQRQFLITTHNPAFLDHLTSGEVVLFDKIDGFTKIKRASDIPEIKRFQKHFRLGELWVQGTLGGIP
ncbi:MAG: ATP-binding protein [candidate division KSB1 bacterium]